MTTKIVGAALAAACTLALIAGPAQASGRTTLVMDLRPDFVTPVSCPSGSLFGFALNVASLDGTPLGTGKSCVKSIDGCDPFVPYCLQTVRATLTLDLERGSLTVPLRLLEVLSTPDSLVQIGTGKVSGGTDAYADAKGRVAGGGQATFDDQGNFTGRLVYTAQLRGVG